MIGLISNQCTSRMRNISVLFYSPNDRANGYRMYSFTYVTTTDSTTTTIAFSFTHPTSFWFLDDIEVMDTITMNLVNIDGGFESNDLSKFYLQCKLPDSDTKIGGETSIVYCKTGDYCYMDETVGDPTYLLHSFSTVGGRSYNIKFWLFNFGGRPNMAMVLIGH